MTGVEESMLTANKAAMLTPKTGKRRQVDIEKIIAFSKEIQAALKEFESSGKQLSITIIM